MNDEEIRFLQEIINRNEEGLYVAGFMIIRAVVFNRYPNYDYNATMNRFVDNGYLEEKEGNYYLTKIGADIINGNN